jgi:hypothetical protein
MQFERQPTGAKSERRRGFLDPDRAEIAKRSNDVGPNEQFIHSARFELSSQKTVGTAATWIQFFDAALKYGVIDRPISAIDLVWASTERPMIRALETFTL